MVNIIKKEVHHLNKVIKLRPEFIQKIVEKLFNNKTLSLFAFKHDFDPNERKANQEFAIKHNLFNKKEFEQALKHINQQNEETAEEFYRHKKKRR